MGRKNDDFGWRVHPITGARSHHDGIDYSVPQGSPISPNIPQTIVKTGLSGTLSSGDKAGTGYGYYTVTKDANGNTYMYAHLENPSEFAPGTVVQPGTPIGYAGSTGGSTGSHLHYEVYPPGRSPFDAEKKTSAPGTYMLNPNSINPATGKPYTEASTFIPGGGGLDKSVKNAVPDKNRANRPAAATPPAPAPVKPPAGTSPRIRTEEEERQLSEQLRKEQMARMQQQAKEDKKGRTGFIDNPLHRMHDTK